MRLVVGVGNRAGTQAVALMPMMQFNWVKTFQIQLALKFSVNAVNALNQMLLACSIKTPFNATELSCAPASTCASRAAEKEIRIHIQSIAIRNRAIATHNRATRIYIRATATRSREIGIYSQEIASYSREIAADSQEMAVNIEEIAGYARRNAAPGLATIARRRFRPIYSQNHAFLPFAARRALHTLPP